MVWKYRTRSTLTASFVSIVPMLSHHADAEPAGLDWDSVEQHQNFINDQEAYARFMQLVDKGADTEKLVYTYHAKFPGDVTSALDAPITEIASWKLHPDTDAEEFYSQGQVLTEMIVETLSDAVTGGGYGKVIEDTPDAAFFIGWQSLEVYI